MAQCLTCKTHITDPHEWNRWDLWCARCHRQAHTIGKRIGGRQRLAQLQDRFARRAARDGYTRRSRM